MLNDELFMSVIVLEVVESLATFAQLYNISEPFKDVKDKEESTIGEPVRVPAVVLHFASIFLVPALNWDELIDEIEVIPEVSALAYPLFD